MHGACDTLTGPVISAERIAAAAAVVEHPVEAQTAEFTSTKGAPLTLCVTGELTLFYE